MAPVKRMNHNKTTCTNRHTYLWRLAQNTKNTHKIYFIIPYNSTESGVQGPVVIVLINQIVQIKVLYCLIGVSPVVQSSCFISLNWKKHKRGSFDCRNLFGVSLHFNLFLFVCHVLYICNFKGYEIQQTLSLLLQIVL
jgi:hypothetical protein